MSSMQGNNEDGGYGIYGGDNSAITSPYEEEEVRKMQQKKSTHNEAEKKRIRTINKCVDELRVILDEAKFSHRSDKVSTLEASVLYMKSLLKERDRLTTSLGSDMDSIVPNMEAETSSDDENYRQISPSPFTTDNQQQIAPPQQSEQNTSRYKGYSLMRRVREAESDQEMQIEEMSPPKYTNEKPMELSTDIKKGGLDSVNYKRIWMNNNIATVVVHIETGQLLKGNIAFMRLFQYTNMEELNRLSLFDIVVVNDLSLFWSEYSQLVNCNRQIIRSFVVSVTNPRKNISVPCLITMGPIMDYEGYVFQVSASFTPLQQVNESEDSKTVDAIGKRAVTLEKII